MLALVFVALLAPPPMPQLKSFYPQLPDPEEAQKISWQIWRYREKLFVEGFAAAVPFDELHAALKPLSRDSYSWEYAGQLNDPMQSEDTRRKALHGLIENIGVQAFERGELPEQCPWVRK